MTTARPASARTIRPRRSTRSTIVPERGPTRIQGRPAATVSPLITTGFLVVEATNSGKAATRIPLPTFEIV